jgi:hypothetical protein
MTEIFALKLELSFMKFVHIAGKKKGNHIAALEKNAPEFLTSR